MRRPRKPDAAAGEADERTVRTAALALLAGRDFARNELAQRLLRRGYPAAVVTIVVDGLAAQRKPEGHAPLSEQWRNDVRRESEQNHARDRSPPAGQPSTVQHVIGI